MTRLIDKLLILTWQGLARLGDLPSPIQSKGEKS